MDRFFDHDDLLAEHALALAVLALADSPDAGALYSDEDLIDDDGERSFPYFKPDFDPILLLGQNYFSHLCMLRRSLISQVGGSGSATKAARTGMWCSGSSSGSVRTRSCMCLTFCTTGESTGSTSSSLQPSRTRRSLPGGR